MERKLAYDKETLIKIYRIGGPEERITRKRQRNEDALKRLDAYAKECPCLKD